MKLLPVSNERMVLLPRDPLKRWNEVEEAIKLLPASNECMVLLDPLKDRRKRDEIEGEAFSVRRHEIPIQPPIGAVAGAKRKCYPGLLLRNLIEVPNLANHINYYMYIPILAP